MAAGAGPIGGASGDAGTEYGRAVGAFAIACGLAGEPLVGFGSSGRDAQVSAVAYQTDDPVDDVRISFATGHTCFIQAKRTLGFGDQFKGAVAQWVKAAEAGLGDHDHVAIAAGVLNGPMQTLRRVLNITRTGDHGSLTAEEQDELDRLNELLADLDDDQRTRLLAAAHIVHLDVEEPSHPNAVAGRLALVRVVAEGETSAAWTQLLKLAGEASRLRRGNDLDGWLDQLAAHVRLLDDGGALLVRRNQVRGRYLDAVRTFGRFVDLRQVGAQLPRTPFDDLDADVRVITNPSDARQTQHIRWAFLRRGRVVLTGLPGAGKSTALALLAADLADLGDTVPILVRLRDLEGKSGTFGDRVLDQACERVGPADADDLRAVLADALAAGDVTLVLDGLDETYRRRHAVVSEIEQFLDTVSPDVDVILATRDVAYADAATLEWQDLRLAAPDDLDRLVRGVLRTAVAHQGVPADDIDEWVAARQAWVDTSMADEPSLRETPLLPTLLALLASERDQDDLPTGRAHVLWGMVEAVVNRSERTRGPDHRAGDLTEAAATSALLQAFELEATMLLGEGPVDRPALTDAIAEHLGPNWGLAPGPAAVAADEAVRFWDETGVFTASGATETVTPRLALFSEIGAARQAARGDATQIRAWVAEAAERDVYECIALAAGLNTDVAASMVEVAAIDGDDVRRHRLLVTATTALRTGAALSTDLREVLKEALLDDAQRPDREGWESMTAALDVLDPGDRDRLIAVASTYPAEHRATIDGLFVLRHPDTVEPTVRREVLLSVLATEWLPKLDGRVPSTGGQAGLQDLMIDTSLSKAVVGAAQELAATDPEPILAVIPKTAAGVSSELSQLMIDHGHAAAVEEIHRASTEQMRAWIERMGNGRDPALDLLAALAGPPHGVLDRQQRRRLDELANVLETMDLNDVSSTLDGKMHLGHGIEVANLVITLAGLDHGVIAAQAQIVRDRMACFEDDRLSPYFALFDLADALDLDRWNDLTDVEPALLMAVELLWGGLGSAWVAIRIFDGAPRTPAAIDALHDVVARLEEQSPRHLSCAAACLTAQLGDVEPHWRTSPNPMLRRVVAQLAPIECDGAVSPVMREMLADPDGSVRVEAVRRVAKSKLADRDDLLRAVVDEGEPQFTCLRCRAVTPASTQFCECCIGGAQPASEARAALKP